MELAEFLGPRIAEIEGVVHRHEGEGGGSGGKPEGLVPHGSEGEFVKAVSGKAVRLFLPYVFNREFRCI